MTLVAVLFAWALFRAPNLPVAVSIIDGMIGRNGLSIPAAFMPALGALGPFLQAHGLAFTLGGGAQFVKMCLWIAALLPVVLVAPNTQQIMGHYRPALAYAVNNRQTWLEWRPTRAWAVASGIVAAIGILALTKHSEFLYFQF